MPSEFSLRQVLACLNISVFDPLVEPALKRACQIEEERKLVVKRNPFYGVFSLIVLQSAALLCFFGLRPYAVSAGVSLILLGSLSFGKTLTAAWRFFFKIYFFAGLFLLAETLFYISPLIVQGMVLLFLLCKALSVNGRESRVLSAFWFFISVLAPFLSGQTVSLFLAIGFFSLIGSAGLLFPLKNLYWREPSIIFAVLPLFVILEYETVWLTRGGAFVDQGNFVMAVMFSVQLLMLIFCLRKDLDPGEIVLSCLAVAGVFFCALFLSGGMAGSAVLFVTAFFTDARVMGRIAIILFSLFLVVFFLSLPISLFAAGLVAALSGIVFGACYLRLKRFVSPEKI